MGRVVVFVALVAACGYDRPPLTGGDAGIDSPRADGAHDARPDAPIDARTDAAIDAAVDGPRSDAAGTCSANTQCASGTECCSMGHCVPGFPDFPSPGDCFPM